jgi:hypothetical protein
MTDKSFADPLLKSDCIIGDARSPDDRDVPEVQDAGLMYNGVDVEPRFTFSSSTPNSVNIFWIRHWAIKAVSSENFFNCIATLRPNTSKASSSSGSALLIDSCNDIRSAIARDTAFDLFFGREGILSVQPGFTDTMARAVAVHVPSMPTHSVSVPDSIWKKQKTLL